MCVSAVKLDWDQNPGVSAMSCQECKHEKGKCNCLCCCSLSQVGCPMCIPAVLGYRQVKKIIRKMKK